MAITLGLILEKVPPVKILDNDFPKLDDLLIEFSGLCSSAKNVCTGVLFVCLGHEDTSTILMAINNGAKGILAKKEIAEKFVTQFSETLFLYSLEPKIALAHLSALFFPGQPKFLAALTGTDGKTSTVNIARQIWGRLGAKSASLGTLGASMENCTPIPWYNNKKNGPAKVGTTLRQIEFHRLIQAMKETAGVEFLALEASSQGLIEHRLDGVKFQVGVFTNFTRDHLDYHETREKYFEAKCHLFKELMLPGGIMILNNSLLNSDEMKILLKIASEKQLTIWTYGTNYGDLHCKTDDSGQTVISLWEKEYIANIPESFKTYPFLMENIVAAIGIVIASSPDFKTEKIISTLPFIKTIPGRMEFVEWENGPSGSKIIIDYAHTSAGFELALPAVRSMTSAKLTVVFGCGGNRETEKRSQMGELASRYADQIIVTDDNCRYEDPALIRKAILEGITNRDGLGVEEIGDRREAIRRGINLTGSQDTLLILGKGAETCIEVKDQLIPFVDREVVESIIKRK